MIFNYTFLAGGLELHIPIVQMSANEDDADQPAQPHILFCRLDSIIYVLRKILISK